MREGQGTHIGKGGIGISPGVQSGISQDESALTSLIGQETNQSQQLFDLGAPALTQATNYYENLASGDPGSITRAIAPQAQQINQAETGAIASIQANDPAGGEKNLAIEQAQLGRAGGIASTATGAVQSANQSLGQLGGQGISGAQSGESLATSGLGTGIQGFGTLGGLQLQSQQLQMEQKGQELGAFGGLAGDASQLGSASMNKGGMMALAAA